MDYETIIGLEVHAQLLTQSKMFCRCSSDYAAAPPNSHVCPVCLGMPGVLPTINKKAIEYTIMTALVLNCTIPQFSKFDRKNYPYPDLMKGYQISQYDAPIGVQGWMRLEVEGMQKQISITRVHLEEDVAKLVHRNTSWGESYSLVDVNRSGVPLMEVVTEPDLRSPEEARQFLIKLRSILQYLGVSTGNMEEGSFRCDANLSIRPAGSRDSLAKVEVKNMNSFKAVYRALEYEAERQRKVAEEGGRLVQETRGWVEERGLTQAQRSKEYAHDYRYFPEPDLPPLTLSPAWVKEISSHLPELPEQRRDRFISQYGLPPYDANLLTSSKSPADYFEACVNLSPGLPPEKRAKGVSNWLLGDFAHLLNLAGIEASQSKVTPARLVELLDLIDQGTLSGPTAKTVFEEMFHSGKPAREIVAEKGLTQISDASAVEKVVRQVIATNTPAVVDFKAGKEQAVKFLVGQVMKATKGRANPKLVNEILRRELEVR
ncbi:MAG TPA: Asp-tRNA(Asn)/Glu-tRNA(Gln) amidotransferase subunit GatB [Dehalococcoidia bacterium]|nr:Asp-tRNA(Asn)/Glu-tRNA(Gln) amidotransferase subunit GatB [Dehalococcoidia bacterium]